MFNFFHFLHFAGQASSESAKAIGLLAEQASNIGWKFALKEQGLEDEMKAKKELSRKSANEFYSK